MEHSPVQLTNFVGRQRELAEIADQLSSVRLLTLVGPGGCGKTRLAQQAALAVEQRFADGAWWVDLAPLADQELVPQSVAAALGVREQAAIGTGIALERYLRGRQILLVLDNCEHLIAGCSTLCDRLLRACPGLVILATSREPLAVPGEVIRRVPGLSLPDSGDLDSSYLAGLFACESALLFVERARAALPHFELNIENASAVSELCRRLDGLPLALELAAARVRVLPVEQIASRLGDALLMLGGGSRTAPVRQQTLRAAVDWSYGLLGAQERLLFRRLSIFAGGWTLEAAESICGFDGLRREEVFELLASLVDKSLLQWESRGGSARYRLLEILRQYAHERLVESGEREDLRCRHSRWYLALAEDIAPAVHGHDQARGLQLIDSELDNMRAALEWFLEQSGAEALRLCTALWFYWTLRSYLSEGRRWFAAALAHPDRRKQQLERLRGQALTRLGALCWVQGDTAAALPLLQESLALWETLGDRREQAYALLFLGLSHSAAGRREQSFECEARAVDLLRGLDDRWGLALAIASLGQVQATLQDYAAARALFEESRALWLALGDRWGLALSLHQLGWLAFQQGAFAPAERLFEESWPIFSEFGDKWHVAATKLFLATIALAREEYRRAAGLAEEGLALYDELGRERDLVWCLAKLTAAALGLDRVEAGVLLAGAGSYRRQSSGARLAPADALWLDRAVLRERTGLPDERFDALWIEGQALSIVQLRAQAQELVAADRPPSPAHSSPAMALELPAGLTPREAEVLRLVAMGMTDAQVAERLVLSPRTINSHLRSIYSKIGVTSRSGATRFAFEHNLV